MGETQVTQHVSSTAFWAAIALLLTFPLILHLLTHNTMSTFSVSFVINRKTNEVSFPLVTPTTREKTAVHITALGEINIYFNGVVEAETIFLAEELMYWEIQSTIAEAINPY